MGGFRVAPDITGMCALTSRISPRPPGRLPCVIGSFVDDDADSSVSTAHSIQPDADDRDLSNSSRSDSGDETEGDDQKTSGMTSGLTRDEIDEDSRTHMSDQSYDSDDSDDDAEYEHVSRSSESEESEADDHDPDYPSGHHCVQTARLQDPISTTMDVADVTDDDDAYEIGILLRLGANGKPIWPKDFSTMYRPKSFRKSPASSFRRGLWS